MIGIRGVGLVVLGLGVSSVLAPSYIVAQERNLSLCTRAYTT